jgi:hypothetical protein
LEIKEPHGFWAVVVLFILLLPDIFSTFFKKTAFFYLKFLPDLWPIFANKKAAQSPQAGG